jgi:hypothetical protein
VEACWAHNPEVRGSKPRSASFFAFVKHEGLPMMKEISLKDEQNYKTVFQCEHALFVWCRLNRTLKLIPNPEHFFPRRGGCV